MATVRRRKLMASTGGEEVIKNPVVGQYILGDLLGEGEAGLVFRAINTENGEFVAMRQLDRSKLSPEEMDRQLKEFARLKAMKHQNIVRLLDTNSTKANTYVVMEYVESGSLAQIIENFDVFPESLTAIYTAQCLRALAYLHENNVVHGGLRGANILITKTGQVKLSDYGAVKETASDVPFWSSPEIINGGKPTRQDDIWSLGCTAIQLFTGAPPYSTLGAVAATLRISQDPCPPLPDEISADFTAFLRECFAKDKPRPSATELLQHPWVRSVLPQQDDPQSTISEIRKYSEVNRRKSIADMLATPEEEHMDAANEAGVMLRVTMEIDGRDVSRTFHANVKATAKVLLSVALNKFNITEDAALYSLSEMHMPSREERIYDDDDMPVDGRQQWELMDSEVGWVVKRKSAPVKEGFLKRKSRLRFGSWKTFYVVLDKDQRYYAYYNKKPERRDIEPSSDVIYSLTHIDGVTISSKNPKQFAIVCNDELHLLQSSSAEETLDWVNQLRHSSRNDFELGYREPFVL